MAIMARATLSQRIFLRAVPLAMTAVFLWASWVAIARDSVPPLVLLMQGLLTALAWYGYLRVPREMSLDDRTLVCTRPAGRLVVAVEEIRRLDVREWDRGFVVITTTRGRIHALRRMPGLAALVTRTAAMNSSVSIRGQLPHAELQR